jgi:hypothetical protein
MIAMVILTEFAPDHGYGNAHGPRSRVDGSTQVCS